jgi:hypothetical protein
MMNFWCREKFEGDKKGDLSPFLRSQVGQRLVGWATLHQPNIPRSNKQTPAIIYG